MADSKTLSSELPQLPLELWEDLSMFDPRSHEFNEGLDAANELARQGGYRLLAIEDIFPPVEVTPPTGFESEVVIQNGARIRTDQFRGRIFGLDRQSDQMSLDVHRLVSDSGVAVQYCDLRPFMSSQIRKGGPEDNQVGKLDRAFLKDLVFFAEHGHPKNTVTSVKGVNYTKLGRSKIRGYWMGVELEDGSDSIIARIGDSADNPKSEENLYRRLFKKQL